MSYPRGDRPQGSFPLNRTVSLRRRRSPPLLAVIILSLSVAPRGEWIQKIGVWTAEL
ncbi:hypothetical protein [Laspinema palackyanum]|uniref:hypothetical protein n=1 Tax=Laspinema palackyanum TaxID=3231601 RepID=UPI00345D1CC6|nr:hypothetical protein [Laspinema sp. D2c]